MSRPDRFTLLAALAFTLAIPACSGDSTSPVTELTLAQVVAQCSRGTIPDATSAIQTRIGRVDAADCVPVDTEFGRIEGWSLPQSSFGALTELQIDVEADFDAVIVILGPNGEFLADSDTDIGGDFGREQYILAKGLSATMPQYFIGVFSYPDEPAGDYQITFGVP